MPTWKQGDIYARLESKRMNEYVNVGKGTECRKRDRERLLEEIRHSLFSSPIAQLLLVHSLFSHSIPCYAMRNRKAGA